MFRGNNNIDSKENCMYSARIVGGFSRPRGILCEATQYNISRSTGFGFKFSSFHTLVVFV